MTHQPTGRTLAYGDLVEDASRLQPPAEVRLKSRDQWHTVGRPVKRLDLRDKVEGKAVFGIDFKLPGMLVAVVARSPMFEGRVKSFNAAEVLKLPGVTHVLKVERDVFGHLREGVAVVATSTWAALRGKRALRVAWDNTGLESFSTQQLLARQADALARQPLVHKQRGAVDDILASPGVVEAIYQTPYQAHACMEPLNCTAHVTPDQVRVWGPIQAPEWVRDHLAGALRRPAAQIEVNCLFMGGAFGRKAFADYPHEAVMLSIATGKPVQVVWDRQDDLSQGPFRPAITYRCKGAIEAGQVKAMEVIGAGPNIGHQTPNPNRTQANGRLAGGLPRRHGPLPIRRRAGGLAGAGHVVAVGLRLDQQLCP
ncbi:MAG: xanthine dehydrogenase family protein molybdopterin-binding subunit [Roseateles sp.]